MWSPCGPYHYPCLPRNPHLRTEKIHWVNSVTQRWEKTGWSQRTTHSFQRNLRTLDSLACRCERSRGPSRPFQTCTCLKTKERSLQSQPEQQPAQKLISDLTWHPSSHVSPSEPPHAAHVVHAAKAAAAAHSCREQHRPLTPHRSTRHVEVSKSHTSSKPVHSSVTWSIHACGRKKKKKSLSVSGIFCLMTGQPVLSYLSDTYRYNGQVKWRTEQMLANTRWWNGLHINRREAARSNYLVENKLEELKMHLNASVRVCHSQVAYNSLMHVKKKTTLQRFEYKCDLLTDLQSPYLLRC